MARSPLYWIPLMKEWFTKKLLLLALAILASACGSIEEFELQRTSQFEQLESAMDRCLDNQNKSQEQLASQQQQLDTVVTSLEELQREAESDPGPAVVAAQDCPPAETAGNQSKLVVGQLEQVWMQDLQLSLPARIDTGAETASLDARNIEQFERNSKKWVRFEIVHPETGETIQLERKRKRSVLILQSTSPEPERRAVIELGVTIGHISQIAEFTLSNRSHLDHQLLIGRNILQDVMIVDVSKKNLAPPQPSESAP